MTTTRGRARRGATAGHAARRGVETLALAAALAAALATAAGCRTQWEPATLAPEATLQWPWLPGAAKVRYDHALTGMEARADARGVLENVVLGRRGPDGAFQLPVAAAEGGDGRVAVADTGCACVHLWLPATSTYVRLDGAGELRFASPVGVAFDDRSRLYVTDSGGRLFAFDETGKPRFSRDRAGDVPLGRPTGIVWAPERGLLHVVDTKAHAVLSFDADGQPRGSFGGRGDGEGRLNFPTHIARSPTGELYVTDTLNFRIAIFDADGKSIGSFGRHGDGSGDFAMPKGVAVDADGVVYVVDAVFDNVQLFSRRGDFLLTVGLRGTGFGEFWLPSGIFLSDTGSLYVCDTYNRRVQVFRVENGYANAAS